MKKFASSDFSGLFYAHRGLYDNKDVPENSLAAFRAAVEKGYGSELDVQLSRDGHVVVFHDDGLSRVCGVQGSVIDHTLEELRQMRLLGTEQTIPLFSDVLDVLGRGPGPIIVELKKCRRYPELCEKTRDLLLAYPGVFCIESFDPRIVLWFRRNAPDFFRGQLAMPAEDYGRSVSRTAARMMAECRFSCLNRPDFIAYKIGARPENVLRMRQRGVLLVAWTSHDPEKDAKENDAVIFEHAAPPIAYPKTEADGGPRSGGRELRF